jgi:hypothetical protein
VDVASLEVDGQFDIAAAAVTAICEKNHLELDEVLASCLRTLQANPLNPSKYHFMSAVYVSKLAPAAFALPKCFEARPATPAPLASQWCCNFA